MFDELVALIGAGPVAAIRRAPGEGDVSRSTLIAQARAVAANVPPPAPTAEPPCVWVATRDPHTTVAAVLGCLQRHSVAPIEGDDPAVVYDSLATTCPPVLVLHDEPNSAVAVWARRSGHPTLTIGALSPESRSWDGSRARSRPDTALAFLTSGTTGTAKRVDIGRDALLAAVCGVGERLELGPADTSLSIAPLNHVLGLVTSVLVALCSGGGVTFADPRRPRPLIAALPALRPTWCAAAPGAHKLVYTLLSGVRQSWPGLRLLRTTSAPIAPDLEQRLEDYYSVPVLSSYAMTEAPGEIASQSPGPQRRRGTVGQPTLCEVEIRSDGQVVAQGSPGEIWIRGPNVVALANANGSEWFATGDLGSLDEDGHLRLTGRLNDIINQSGHKIWPSDVEDAALTLPAVASAVAFPIPHDGLGETVGLAVVPATGQVVDRATLRRELMARLPRQAWPSAIVVCAEIPVSARGKVQRRMLWHQLPELPSRPRPRSGSGHTRH